MTMTTLIITYVIGFVLTLTFLKFFGKKIGIDYSGEKDDWYDDWESNTTAYTAFSIGWFIIMPILSIAGIWKALTYCTRIFLNDNG